MVPGKGCLWTLSISCVCETGKRGGSGGGVFMRKCGQRVEFWWFKSICFTLFGLIKMKGSRLLRVDSFPSS